MKYWGDNKGKLSTRLIQKARWNNQFQGMTWRVDLRALSSDTESASAEDNAPMAFFELGIRHGAVHSPAQGHEQEQRGIRFEMTHGEVKKFNSALDAIAKAIHEAS